MDDDADVPSELIEELQRDRLTGARRVAAWLQTVVPQRSRASPEFTRAFFEQLSVVVTDHGLQIHTLGAVTWGPSVLDWSDRDDVAGVLQVQCQNTLDLVNEEWDRSQQSRR